METLVYRPEPSELAWTFGALSKGFLRIIDESGEDYLYPVELFAFVDVPDDAAQQLRDSQARQ